MTRGALERSLHINQGQVIFATSNALDDGLVAHLLRRGVISLSDREETARRFTPDSLVGIYLSRVRRPANGDDVTYLRVAFGGRAAEPEPGRALDAGIVRTLWMSLADVRASRERHRSPLVLRCIEDRVAGRRLPLDTVYSDPSVFASDADKEADT